MSSIVAAVPTADLEGQPNNTRFKVVKIDGQRSTAGKSHPKGAEDGHVHEHLLLPNGQKSFTYKRGRWTVTDFYDPAPLPPVAPLVPVSNPSSSSNSTPSTPTLTPAVNPLTRAPAASLPPEPEPALPTSPPVFEDIAAHPPLAPTSIRSANTVERQEHPILPLTSLVTHLPVPAAASPLSDAPVECKDMETAVDHSSILSLSQPSVLSPDDSQPVSRASSSTSPSVPDLTSLAKVIRAHPDAVTAVTSPTRGHGPVSMSKVEVAATAAAISAAIRSADRTEKVAASGQAAGDAVSGYATPASIHSVTGANASSILPPYVSSVAIDNKIEQAMDLVKSHLMFAVREEVDVLKEKIVGLLERIQALETENAILKQSHDMQQHTSQNNQMTQSVFGNMSQASSPEQAVNPDSTHELASLVSEVALTSPVAHDDACTTSELPDSQVLLPVANSATETPVPNEDSQ